MRIEKAYDLWSEQYDSNNNPTRDLDKGATQCILSELNYENVLELGCGTGKNTVWFIGHAKNVQAIDFSEKMLSIARKKIRDAGVRFQKADIRNDWDWAATDYDLITCNLILEHIEDLNPIFKKAHSHLARGGYFFVSELHPFKQYKGSRARFDSKDGQIELESFTHHVSDFTSAAQKADFDIIRIDEYLDADQKQIPRLISFLFKKP